MGNLLTRFKRHWAEDLKEPPPSISLCELLERYPNKPWDIAGLSASEFITIDFVKKHKNWKWDWQKLSANPNITFKDIMANLDLNWRAKGLSMNPNVSSNDILNVIPSQYYKQKLFIPGPGFYK